jgi:hypothetical protein
MEGFDYQYFWRLFGTDPYWLTQMIVFVTVAYTCCIFGVVFGKMGRSPFWGFMFLPPYFGVIATWVFGLMRCPQEEVTDAARSPSIKPT